MSTIDDFVERVSSIRLDHCFNPYADICSIYDAKCAPAIRKENLRQILTSVISATRIDIWVGRDLGYRGGRRTGLALTDEYSLELYALHLGLQHLPRATNGNAIKERTAENIFRILTKVDVPILTWNVFPFHPHDPGNPFTNRQHTKSEARIGITFLEELCDLLPVTRVVAIGNDAALWAETLHANCARVRHPSYGGQAIFLAQMTELYGLAHHDRQMKLL